MPRPAPLLPSSPLLAPLLLLSSSPTSSTSSMSSTSSTLASLCLCLLLLLSSLTASEAAESAAKRDPSSGFYTTRFGRSDPTLGRPSGGPARGMVPRATSSPLYQGLLALGARPRGVQAPEMFGVGGLSKIEEDDEGQQQQQQQHSRLGLNIKGYDDKGQTINCVYYGSNNHYICQREEDAWSF